MTFLHELAVRVTAAVAAGKTPDLENYLEQQEGEEVLGFVSDAQLLALIAIRDDQDFEPLVHLRQSSRRKRAAANFARVMNQYLQIELQRAFVNMEDIPVGLRRKGNDLVAVKFRKEGRISLKNLVAVLATGPASMTPAHATRNSC